MAKDVIIPADLGGTPLSPDEMAQLPDFACIRKEIWAKFPGSVARRTLRAGDVLFREGEGGTTAFYLLSGTLEVSLNSPVASVESSRRPRPRGLFRGFTKLTHYVTGKPETRRHTLTHIPMDGPVDLPLDRPIAQLRAGELFGELCALAAFKQDKIKRPKFYPRSATVRALTDAEVLEILPNILNNVLYNSPAFKEKLNQNYRTRALDTHLRSVPIFQGVSQEFIDYIRDRVDLVDFPPGDVICKQGDLADAFYLIRLGFVKVSQQFPGGEMVLSYLSRGSYFGEIGLLPPAFRVRARGPEAQAAEIVVGADPVICGRAPLNKGLAVLWDDYISRDHFQMRAEGKQLRVALLDTGKNPITYRNRPATSLLVSPGESFVAGGTTFEVAEDPMRSGRRTATCTAMDFVQLVRIKAEDFAKVLAEFPQVTAGVNEVARARRDMSSRILNRVQTVSLNDFLAQELMQGQNLLLLDLDRCTRCDECVKACVATHDDGVTRLIRDGLRFDHYLVPTSCRACMDPLCMTRCPVGSIRRKETLDIVIEDWCIGCGNCANDCPYGTINIVELPVPGTLKKQQAEVRPKAVVCDLCVDYPEPNCVRACPHAAAIRVEPKRFFAQELAGTELAVPVEEPVPSPAASELAATRVISNVADLLPLLPKLKIASGPRAGAILQLRYPTTTFGRGVECDYRFSESEGISRVHCTLTAENRKFVLRDLQSTNGTFVNGNQVDEIELRNGDVIQIGDLELEFLEGVRQ
jgi:CRP-like cAMP-binding protein/Fe-S-cluster-containing hydrogenase component 2